MGTVHRPPMRAVYEGLIKTLCRHHSTCVVHVRTFAVIKTLAMVVRFHGKGASLSCRVQWHLLLIVDLA